MAYTLMCKGCGWHGDKGVWAVDDWYCPECGAELDLANEGKVVE